MPRKDEKFLSIVIPNYNNDVRVLKAIESIGIYNHDELEIIVCDDYSEKKIIDNLKEILKLYPSVKLIENRQNLGLVKNWNNCLRQSSGQWVGLLCCDDEYMPGAIEKVFQLLKTLQEPMLILHDRFIDYENEYFLPGSDTAKKLRLPLASGNFWHRKIIDNLGGFDERLKYSPDAEYWYRIVTKFPVMKLKYQIAIYNQHENNYMWETWRKDDFLQQIELLSEMVINYQHPDIKDSEKNLLIQDGLKKTVNTILECCIGNKTKIDIYQKYRDAGWAQAVSFSEKYRLFRSLSSAWWRNFSIRSFSR